VSYEKLTKQLIRQEGLMLKPYKCIAEKLTIGVGRNLDDVGISKDEALYLLSQDIITARNELVRVFPWTLELDEVRFQTLVNMVFNLGISRLSKFTKTMSLIHDGEYDVAATEMLDSRWAKQVGNRAIELSEQMRTGSYAD